VTTSSSALDPQPGQPYRVDEVLGIYPAVREEHVRELQKQRLIEVVNDDQGHRVVSFAHLLVIRRLHGELTRGASFRAVLRAIKAAHAGQLALDFRKDSSPATVVALAQPPVVVQVRASLDAQAAPAAGQEPVVDAVLAEEYFGEASALDDGTAANQDRAAAAYRKALEFDPQLVPAIINLANIHYARDELIEAQALYEHAIGIEPSAFEGHFNLGNIHHDLGRFADADRCYRRALAISPGSAEAHLYLAVVLEKSDRPADARAHWRHYRRLAPDGDWADLAREFCDQES